MLYLKRFDLGHNLSTYNNITPRSVFELHTAKKTPHVAPLSFIL